MSRYDDYESTQTSGTYTYFEPNQTLDPNNPVDTLSDLVITDSIDAATSSLQLGTDPLETQVIEIGSAGVTTTVYGAVNLLHPINVLSVTITNDLNVHEKTTLQNVSATELTSTYLEASILKTTTLNASGTTTLGLLYAVNCSLMNVSASRVELNTLTAVNCSVSNVSAASLDANTLTANNVSTTNLTIGNALSAISIPTGYTTVDDVVGTSIPLTFTSVTLNGVITPPPDEQTNYFEYSSTNKPENEYNMITGKLNLTPVFAQTTYRVCISVNYLNNPVDLSFQDDAGTIYTLGPLDTIPRKKYLFYLKPTVTGRLYLTISRAALSGAAEIEYDFLSVEPWYETNLSNVNVMGSLLLASGGGQVGVGTTTPQYTLDVSGTMRVTGEVYIGSTSSTVTTTGSNIKQVVPLLGGGQIENIVGNTTVASSMSTTFNRKYITPVGGAISCYTITSNSTDQFTTQYFEIFVSGANNSRGGYTYKGCFGVEKNGSVPITTSAVTTLFYLGSGVNPPTSTVTPVIDFTLSGQVLTLRVNTSGGGSIDQSFITTLTAYPTYSIRGSVIQSEDYIITAV